MLKKLLIILLFLIMGIRIVYLNVYEHESYITKLNEKTNKYIYGTSAPRGRILDRNGVILVDNIGKKTIYYNKLKKINYQDEIIIAYQLANLIDIKIDKNTLKQFWLINNDNGDKLITDSEWQKYNERKISKEEINNLKIARIREEEINSYTKLDQKAATIYALMNVGYSYAPKEIVSDLSDETYAKIIENNIPGITGGLKWVRIYPYQDVLKDIFGTVSKIPYEKKEEYQKLGYNINDLVGTSYLELQYEEYLKGKKDLYKVNSDNTLSLIEEGYSGNDLYLSIDINIQLELEKTIKENILKAKKYKNTDYLSEAYSIISDPTTGEILAMSGQKLKNSDLKNPVWQNVNSNLITKSYTVGSVVKGASISVGYKYGVIDINTKMKDGCVKLDNVPIKCSYKNLGTINDLTAIAKSSNYYQFMIAIGITNNKYKYNMKLQTDKKDFDKFRDLFKEYGLGTLTNIDLPNEKTGIIGKNYSSDLLLNLAIGQYDTYTPIELLQYTNTLANLGVKKTPMLMKKIVNNHNKILISNDFKEIGVVSIDEKYRSRIREAMNLATKSGTAKNYIDKKYDPAGKTGTSETFIDTNNDGIMDTATTSIQYIGFAPYNDPKFSIIVIVPNIYVKKEYNYSKVYITRPISNSISNFFFENT